MKHTLFLVHGIGVHEPNVWAKEVIDKLEKVSKRYEYFRKNPLNDQIEFVPINYDNIINEILEEWKQAEDIVEFATKHELKDEKVLNFLKSLTDEDKKFLWTHLADVIIYRFFSTYQNLIRISVIKQFATKIDELIDQNGQAICSVIAHSLGTAVSHDCIHILGTEGWENTDNVFSPEHWKFQSVFMIANTSKLLESDIDPYKSIVKPGKIGDKNSYLFKYLDFWHELDPVPNIKKFDPPWKFDSIGVNHYREYNIHSFMHYLDNPKVHIPILRSITNIWSISKEEEKEAIENYPQFGGDLEFGQDVKESIEMLKQLLQGNKSSENWLEMILKFIQIVNKFENKEIK